jgi:toxin ParE1/3/4
MKINLRRRAQADLDAIWDYTYDRWGVEQADFYVQEIRRTIEQLARDVPVSSDVGHLHRGLRKARAGSHLVYFFEGEQLDVVRILHERQDAASLI